MSDRLDSWKAIADYLRRGVRTVQRWEREEALPVHRLQHEKLGSVYAYPNELDAWWSARGSKVVAEARPDPPAASVAVLPFADLSREQDQEYLCDGMAEEIISALTRIRGLRVASRSASFHYRGKSVDTGAAAQALKVSALLEGSIRRQNQSLRIAVQLVDVQTGFHIWSETYDRSAADLFAVQEDIARSVASALEVTLTPKESAALARVPTEDAEAHDLYLRGRAYYYRYGPRDMEHAIQLFHQAVARDSSFAAAWAGLADCWSYLFLYSDRSDLLRDQAAWAAARAVELDSGSAQAWASLGLACSLQPGQVEAEAAFERAVQLDPGLFEAWYFRARYAFARGQHERALHFYQEAMRIRPDDYQTPLLMAQIYDDLGRSDEARRTRLSGIETAEGHLRLHPDDVRATYFVANGLAALGKGEQAREYCDRALALRPDDGMVLYNVGCVYALLGLRDESINVLERAVKWGLREKGWFEHDSNLDSLRLDPRFAELLASL